MNTRMVHDVVASTYSCDLETEALGKIHNVLEGNAVHVASREAEQQSPTVHSDGLRVTR